MSAIGDSPVAGLPLGAARLTYAETVLADTPAAYYRLDESSGTTMVDSSGNTGRNGVYAGSPTLGVAGLLVGDTDTAISLASGQYGTVSHATWMDTASFSVEAVIKMTSILSVNNVIADRDDELSQRSWQFYVNSTGNLCVDVWVSGAVHTCVGASILTAGTAFHVATTYDGTTIRVYVDGGLDASLAVSGVVSTSTAPLWIGANMYSGYTATWRLNGVIDEVAVYGYALNASRLAAHYVASGLPVPAQPTVDGYAYNTAVLLHWNTVPGATSYDVSDGTTVHTVTGVLYEWTGLTNGVAKTFTVAGRNGAGAGTAASVSLTPVNVAKPYSAVVLLDAPVVYVKLDETAGTVAKDSSGYGHDFSYSTGSVLGQTPNVYDGGATGYAAKSNGSNTVAINTLIPAPLIAPAAWTMEAWVNLTASLKGAIIYIGNSGSNGYGFGVGGGAINVLGNDIEGLAGAVAFVNTTAPIGTGIHHVALTCDSTGWYFYVDGVLVSTHAAQAFNPATGWINLGDPGLASTTLDDVAIYATRLSTAQLLAHYTAGAQPPTAANLTATATLSAAGTTTGGNVATLAETATLTAAATLVQQAAVSLLETATLSPAAQLALFAVVALSETATLSATGAIVQSGVVALSSTATLSAVGVTGSIAVLSETATLSVDATREKPVAAALSETATLTAAFGVGAAAALTATATLTATPVDYGVATLTETASLSVAVARETFAIAFPAETSTLTADAIGQSTTAALTATFTLTASASRLRTLPSTHVSIFFTAHTTVPVRKPGGTGLNPVPLVLGLAGHGEVTTLTAPSTLDLRVAAGVSITLPEPAFVQGKPLIPDYWARMSSSASATGALVVPDPDPIITTGPGNPNPGGVAPAYVWHVSDLTPPGSSPYHLSSWPPHGGVGPKWTSAGTFQPRVIQTVLYGAKDRFHTYTAGVHFDGTAVQHMWLDWGASLPQPFSVVICGIIHYYPQRTYGHYLLDAGMPTSTVYADGEDHTFNENMSYRSLMLYQSHNAILATHTGADAVRNGKHVITRADFAPRPKMFFGVFNGASSYIGAWDMRNRYLQKGAIDVKTHRNFVMGRRQNNVSDNLASHMTVFEVRMFAQALSPSVLTEIFHQLAATWKFSLYHV